MESEDVPRGTAAGRDSARGRTPAGAGPGGEGALRIADLVAIPELRLTVAAGHRNLGRPIEAAHVSELLTPGQWLQGGELLMTIGLLLPMTDEACAAYVRDAAAGGAGACGLVLGLGRDLPYQSAPDPLVRAARAAGMPLLTVPDEVPFIAVTKAVFEARAALRRRALERAFEAQRRLTTAAASGQGLTATLRAWSAATGVDALVADPLGRLIADAAQDPGTLLADAGDLVRRVAARGLHGSGSSTAGAADGTAVRVEVLPLGAERLRGLLVLAGHIDADARLLASGLVSLLSLELERRHLADEPVRRRRAALLGRLLAPDTTADRARDVLAAAGLAAETVRGFAVESAVGSAGGSDAVTGTDLAADLALAVPGGLVRVVGDMVEVVCGGDIDVFDVLARFAPGAAAGIGPLTAPEDASFSMRGARALVPLSRRAGRPVENERGASGDLLLSLADRGALAGFADAVLGPLEQADGNGELTATLEAWLEAGGSWDETSRRLAVHRHTVRNRMDKAMAATGRRLDDGGDRFDLWLALRIRRQGV
ncbi:PucR family transcriptional regulator [Yinghuangia sp. YIM S09857]|uniref:PucR family transcriptional regulator n=1 Tax=Yinghuangia sp. YIM S09857 TaxID=3436929 RepID=UPI003F531164